MSLVDHVDWQDCQHLVQLCEDIGFRTRWSQAHLEFKSEGASEFSASKFLSSWILGLLCENVVHV